jgi:hypothetical protein
VDRERLHPDERDLCFVLCGFEIHVDLVSLVWVIMFLVWFWGAVDSRAVLCLAQVQGGCFAKVECSSLSLSCACSISFF